MFTPEQVLTDPAIREVPYGPGRVARFEGGGRWLLFYDPRGRALQPAGSAMTSDVLAKQRSGSFEEDRIKTLVASQP